MTMTGVAKKGDAPKGDLCLLFSFASSQRALEQCWVHRVEKLDEWRGTEKGLVRREIAAPVTDLGSSPVTPPLGCEYFSDHKGQNSRN